MSFEPNEMMMELFRSEVESHSDALTSSLLALEQEPTATTALEHMMRAAHSIKGAARIVRVSPAAEVAHVMEDCFVAAQKGKLTFKPDDVDVLLRGVDLLVKISAATKDQQADWTAVETSSRELAVELKRVLDGRPAVAIPAAPVAVSLASDLDESSPLTPPAETTPLESSIAIITCPRVLDAAAAEIVRRELLRALEAGAPEIQLDLAATRDLDAIGLALLAAARRHVATQSHATLRFQPVSQEMRTVLKLTGLDATATEAAVL